MSAALCLKQSIYQLSGAELLSILSRYFTASNQDYSSITTQKAYKCFECCILVNHSKYCAGYGRNEEEAALNAGRIALESIIDSGDTSGLSKLFSVPPKSDSEPSKAPVVPDDLHLLLNRLGCADSLQVFLDEKLEYKDLAGLNLDSLKLILPLGAAAKLHSHFHPTPTDAGKLQEMNEVPNI